MADIQPRGESLRRAVRWVSDHRREDPDRDVMPFVHEAITRFDLDPGQAEYLIGFFRKASPGAET